MGLETKPDNLVLCEAIIVMAHKLGLKVIAEGVESREQCDLLANCGCDFAQGFLFSKPVPADEFEILLRQPLARSGQRGQAGAPVLGPIDQ